MKFDRLSLPPSAIPSYEALLAFEHTIDLDPRLRVLLQLRASQINGCAYCIDMHWKDARAGGESEERLYGLDAWREIPSYSERERAALALCEAMTLISEDHVPDDVWNEATRVFSNDDVTRLMFTISAINVWNRLMITARAEPGDYHAKVAS